MGRYKCGDRVIGRTRKYEGRRGVVVAVHKESKQHSYDVQWKNGDVLRAAARALSAESDVMTQEVAKQPLQEVFFPKLWFNREL